MTDAQCRCGAVRLSVSGQPKTVVACHCLDCQRRTGAPFGAGAFYPTEAVASSGAATQYTRVADSGGKVHSFFCPTCGSSVYWKADNLPGFIGVAIGAFAGAEAPAPAISIFEQSKHAWAQIEGPAVAHFPQGTLPRSSAKSVTP